MIVATRAVTVEEFERATFEGPCELVEGEIREVPPSAEWSSSVAGRLIVRLGSFVLDGNLGRIYGADGAFVLFPDRATVRVPDVSFVRAERAPTGEARKQFSRLAPDLAVEVVSPSDRMPDVLAKVAEYLDAGVRLVWVIEPIARWIAVYTQDGPAALLHEGDTLDGGDVLPGFTLPVADIFA